MKVLCFIVNYRADEPLRQCLVSLERAALGVEHHVEVHVLDNSEYDAAGHAQLREMLSAIQGMPVHLHLPPRNGGYFGGLALAQSLAADTSVECVIYSNPDLRFASDFFARLGEFGARFRGVLAPSIVSRDDGFDQNPKYVQRLSSQRLKRLKRIYASRVGFALYMSLARVKERLLGKRARPASPSGQTIYAPHGAAFVFTDMAFFAALPAYPCFLFGEELFIAEEARLRKVPVSYAPGLRIDDMRSQSVRHLPGEFHRRLMLKSVEFIVDRYHHAAP